MTATQWPSDQTGGRRTRAGRPARRDTIKSDWVSPLVIVSLIAAVIAGAGSTAAPFITDTFQQVSETLGAGK